MATYDDVRDKLDTGDIVLFSGKGLISMGLLPSEECGGNPCSEYTPKDFSTEGGGIELLLGATLGREIAIREG